MANWLIIVDENEDRKARYLAALKSSISPFDGLEVGSAEGTGWGVAWAAGRSAPVDADFDRTGGAVIWGEPRNELGELQSAGDVATAWHGGAAEQWDGFYSAVAVDSDSRVIVAGTDLLGVWPVYHWSNRKGVSLIGTSPKLFCDHDEFSAEIDMDGLIGILLTNGTLDNQSLWKGVRRLTPGNRVIVRNGDCREDVNYRVPVDIETVDMPFRGHVRLLERSVQAAVARHAPQGPKYGLMLSGGLDSRLLAGFLAAQKTDARCVTFGKSRDFEMRGAKAVAKAVGFNHTATEIPASAYADAAKRHAHWEMLGAGFSGVPEWAMYDILSEGPERLVVGHGFDGIAGGIHIGWAYDSKSKHMGLDVLLPTILAWGLQPAALKKLVGSEHAAAVDAAMERIETVYNELAPREHHRAWLFDLQYRQRLHVGSALWPISFASWPVVPYLDRDVVRVCAAMPSSSIADRRAQFALLARCFPRLAALPLDRNSWDDMPPQPQLKDFVRRSINYRIRAIQQSVRNVLGKELPDRVYYHRLYDFNSPGWRSVRRLAEPDREYIKRALVADEVDAILPQPEATKQFDNCVKDPSAARMLMGLGMIMRHAGVR